ncbi:hypothetical protein ACFVJM_35390 [Streptomyces virginiae]|uniref:hypothetical protein n=1 Tax=Streptomyces virginiae TaxID=1961 RepID=UPI00363CABD8
MTALLLPITDRKPHHDRSVRRPREGDRRARSAVKILWWVALAVLVLWMIGFVARPKGRSGRWYRW